MKHNIFPLVFTSGITAFHSLLKLKVMVGKIHIKNYI